MAEETKATADIKQQQENIHRRLKALRESNQSMDAFLIRRENQELAAKKLHQEKQNAIQIITHKWAKELDENISLIDKIVILDQWTDLIMRNAPIRAAIERDSQLFLVNLEKIKKDFSLEMLHDELTKDEEQAIQQKLENMIGRLLVLLGKIQLSSKQTFTAQWVHATSQQERDETLKDLVQIVIKNFEAAKGDKEAAENAKINLAQATGFLHVSRSLITPQIQLELFEKIKQADPNLTQAVDILTLLVPQEI